MKSSRIACSLIVRGELFEVTFVGFGNSLPPVKFPPEVETGSRKKWRKTPKDSAH